MERPTLFGGMPRYGKRRAAGGYSYGGKRRRGAGSRVRLSGRSQFINQLGGWSANKGPAKEKSKVFEFTTAMRSSNLTILTGRSVGVRDLVFQPTYHFGHQNIFPKFQKWKLKKLEVYIDVTNISGSEGVIETVQFSIAKNRDRTAPDNVLNVPGCQTKILRITDGGGPPNTDANEGQLDVLRAACFWPPVSMAGRNPNDTTSLSYLENPWMDGKQYATSDFNAFAVQVTRSVGATRDTTYNFLYYFKTTWIANTPVFNQI